MRAISNNAPTISAGEDWPSTYLQFSIVLDSLSCLKKDKKLIFIVRVYCLKMTLETIWSHCAIAEIFIAYHAL